LNVIYLIVQSEDIVVDADGVELDETLDGAENVEHDDERDLRFLFALLFLTFLLQSLNDHVTRNADTF